MRTKTIAWMLLTTALCAVAATLWITRPAPSHGDGVDPIVLVGEIQELARLETASVELETTVRGTRGQGWLRDVAGEQLVFQGVGEASAGVDLSRLGPDDLWVDADGVVWIRLPPAELFEVTLDPRRSQVLARQKGWLGRSDIRFETDARRAALAQLQAQAEVIGLEEEAAQTAREVVRDLLLGVGAPAVRFSPSDRAAGA